MRFSGRYRCAALLLALVLLFCCAACGQTETAAETAEDTAQTTGGTATQTISVDAASLPASLTIVCDGITGTFDPRYAEEAGDLAVAQLTGVSLLTVDAGGAFIYSAASAGMAAAPADVSVHSDGSTAVYTITLREELDYTAAELEALYLQLLDGDYTGPRTVAEAPIAGLTYYQSGISAAAEEALAAEYAYGPDEELQAQCLLEAWYAALAQIEEECTAAALSQPVDTFGISASDAEMTVALAMALRGFGELDGSGVMTGLATGNTWTLTDGDVPDRDDFYSECYACYLGDADAFSEQELGDADALQDAAMQLYITARAAEEGYSADSVSGITVVDEKTLTITVESGDLRYVYHVCDVILPDLGPWVLTGESSGTLILEARSDYFGGTPAISTLYLTEEGEGDIDVTGEGTGSYTVWQNAQSFGYIGLNADQVLVGSNSGSAQSIALRTALTGLLAVYRERTVSAYYGDEAAVLNVPVAADSWTAPEEWTYPADADAAVLQAKELLLTAGYTWSDTEGVFTEAPEGASLTFTLLIPADGTGDHPAAALAKQASALFTSLGLTLEVEDVSEAEFWSRLAEGDVQLWAAAWEDGADTDPSRWYSLCGLREDYQTLCETALQTGTAAAYQAAYDVLEQWQVVLPFYQRRSTVTFSGSLPVIPDRLTGDYGWVRWLTDLCLGAV